MAATRKKQEIGFDDAKLQKLSEPITVHVNKIIAGRGSPISLPLKPGESVSGKGWTHDDVRQLETFLCQEWSGGGQYSIVATGDNGEQMKWEPYYPESKYPPKDPPSMQSGHPSTTPTSTPAASDPSWMTAVARSYPTAPPPQQPPAPTAPYPGYGFGGYAPAPPAATPYGGMGYAGGLPAGAGYMGTRLASAPRNGDPEVSKEREERLKLENRLEQDKIRHQHEKELAALTQELRQLQDKMAHRPGAESDERVRKLEDQLRQERDRFEQTQSQNQIVQMMNQQAQQTKDLIQSLQQNTERQIQAMERRLEDLGRRDGPDPTMQLMMTMMQQNAQAQREAMQMQMQMQRDQAQSQMGPREVMDLVSRFNQGADQQAQAFGRAWELMMQGVEAIMASQPQPVHPALEMLQNAAAGGLQLGQQYLAMKQHETQSHAHVQQQAMAQQQQLAQQRAEMQAQQRAQIGAAMTSGEVPEDEQGGDEQLGDMTEGELESQLFGPLIGEVEKLRRGVADGQLSAQQAAAAVLQGIQVCQQRGIRVPAFDMWDEGEIASLVGVLIPDAKTSFQEHLAQELFAAAQTLYGENGASSASAESAGHAPPIEQN